MDCEDSGLSVATDNAAGTTSNFKVLPSPQPLTSPIVVNAGGSTANANAKEHDAVFLMHYLNHPEPDTMTSQGANLLGPLVTPPLYTPPLSVIHAQMPDKVPYYARHARNPHMDKFLTNEPLKASATSLFADAGVPLEGSYSVMSEVLAGIKEGTIATGAPVPGTSLAPGASAVSADMKCELPTMVAPFQVEVDVSGGSRKRTADDALISPQIPASEPKKGRALTSKATPKKGAGKKAASKKATGKKAAGKKAAGKKAASTGRNGKGRDPTKRAEQNRRASRKYRERTKNRLREMEEKLAALQLENDKLKALTEAQEPDMTSRGLQSWNSALLADASPAFVDSYTSSAGPPPSAQLEAMLKGGMKLPETEAAKAFQMTLANAKVQERVERERASQDAMIQLLKNISPEEGQPVPIASASNADPFEFVSAAKNPLGLSPGQVESLMELRREHTTTLGSILRRRASIISSLRAMMREHMSQLFEAQCLNGSLLGQPGVPIIASLIQSLRENFSQETRSMDSITARFFSMLSPAQQAQWLVTMCNSRYCRFSVLMAALQAYRSAPPSHQLNTTDPLEAMLATSE